MNVGKLKRVAITELKRSPAKTGILLAMLPVAFYFCVPPLIGVLKKSSAEKNVNASSVAAQADFVLAATPPSTAAPQQQSRQSWMEVAKWIEHDLLAVPAGIPLDARDPFASNRNGAETELLAATEDDERVVLEETDLEVTEQAVESTAVTTNPIRDLALDLNATMVGQRSRLATINGKTYEQGDKIPVIIESDAADDAVTEIELQLSVVARRFVVVEFAGHKHRLQLRNEVPTDAIVVKSRRE